MQVNAHLNKCAMRRLRNAMNASMEAPFRAMHTPPIHPPRRCGCLTGPSTPPSRPPTARARPTCALSATARRATAWPGPPSTRVGFSIYGLWLGQRVLRARGGLRPGLVPLERGWASLLLPGPNRGCAAGSMRVSRARGRCGSCARAGAPPGARPARGARAKHADTPPPASACQATS